MAMKRLVLFSVLFLSGTIFTCTGLILFNHGREWIYETLLEFALLLFNDFLMEPKATFSLIAGMICYYQSYQVYKKC